MNRLNKPIKKLRLLEWGKTPKFSYMLSPGNKFRFTDKQIESKKMGKNIHRQTAIAGNMKQQY